jgi:hypothetical protein
MCISRQPETSNLSIGCDICWCWLAQGGEYADVAPEGRAIVNASLPPAKRFVPPANCLVSSAKRLVPSVICLVLSENHVFLPFLSQKPVILSRCQSSPNQALVQVQREAYPL